MKKGKNSNKRIFWNMKKIIPFIAIGIITLGIVGYTAIMTVKKKENNNLCLVEFNSNGGTQLNSELIRCGGHINTPDIPTKEGFSFLGWFLNEEKVNFEGFAINHNMMLEARWEANDDTEVVIVYFDSQGGSEIKSIEIAKGSILTPPYNPKKDGYKFKYWSIDDKRFDFSNIINSNLTLVAIWEKSEETINNIANANKDDEQTNVEATNICEYEKKDINSEYNGHVPEMSVGLGETYQLYSFFGFWSYNSSNCNIIYRSEDNSIASVSENGAVVGKKLGSTIVDICVLNKRTQEQLDCFNYKINIQYNVGTKRATDDSINLVNAIKGYYWYADGYNYSYLKADEIDWYGRKVLSFSSEFIIIKNKNFIFTESSNDNYTPNEIQELSNTFGVDSNRAYELIEKYNMHVSGNKLYITMGSKTYSFTKQYEKRKIIAKISVEKNTINVQNNSSVDFNVIISPSYAPYSLSVYSSNTTVVSNCRMFDKTVSCYANKEGTSKITVVEASGSQVEVNINVSKVNVTGITLNKSNITITRGASYTEQLIATIVPSNATNQNIIWKSNNTEIATVSNKGKVLGIKEGNTLITATTEDGNYVASCEVTVINPPLSASCSIGLKSYVNQNGSGYGLDVQIKPSGGSGKYEYYYVRVYTADGMLIGQTTITSNFSIFIPNYSSGSYYAEFEVRDSKGAEYSGKTSIINISQSGG